MPVGSCAPLKDGQTWLVLDAPGIIGLHRSSDGGLISSWQVPEMNGQIERDSHVAISRNGRSAAWNPNGSRTVWLLRLGQAPYALQGHSLRLSRIEFFQTAARSPSTAIGNTPTARNRASCFFTRLSCLHQPRCRSAPKNKHAAANDLSDPWNALD